VAEAEVLEQAAETYGRIPARGERPQRFRPREPEPHASRRVTVRDGKVEQPLLRRLYLAPSVITARSGEAFALDVLAEIFGGGPTSVLYRDLVMDKKAAVSAGAWYMGNAVDATRFGVTAAPRPGMSLGDLETMIDDTVADFIAKGVDEADFQRAKTRLVAEMVYAQDSQATLARVYGSALAIGESLEDVSEWPSRIEAVTPDAVIAAARTVLDARRAVTGYLEPERA
jgi:zinc protease